MGENKRKKEKNKKGRKEEKMIFLYATIALLIVGAAFACVGLYASMD